MSADGRSGEGSAEQSGGLPAVQPGALSAELSGAVPGEQPAALPAGLSGEVTASRRVVISSVTGKPIPWESEESDEPEDADRGGDEESENPAQ